MVSPERCVFVVPRAHPLIRCRPHSALQRTLLRLDLRKPPPLLVLDRALTTEAAVFDSLGVKRLVQVCPQK